VAVHSRDEISDVHPEVGHRRSPLDDPASTLVGERAGVARGTGEAHPVPLGDGVGAFDPAQRQAIGVPFGRPQGNIPEAVNVVRGAKQVGAVRLFEGEQPVVGDKLGALRGEPEFLLLLLGKPLFDAEYRFRTDTAGNWRSRCNHVPAPTIASVKEKDDTSGLGNEHGVAFPVLHGAFLL